jgi:tRNA1(Val) A37 N6-methylase TrmN6
MRRVHLHDPEGGLWPGVFQAIKLGYYPLPPAEGARLRRLRAFEPGASAADPCAGTGAALHQLTEGAEVDKHGVELDAGRATASAASGITTVHGNLFDTIGKAESVSFLYLNPPYDAEIGSRDNKGMEYLFIEHTFRWLVEGGVLLMVVPQERLDTAIPLLAGNFTDLQIYRLTDPEAERFDQVALFGGDPNHGAESGMVRKVDLHGAYDHIIPPIEEAWAHLPVLAFPNA